ncbi:MAG: hypothetical protein E6J71_27600 [Deltaproteobacteria bacterium]|nr:MAG: hypothetical protein E6J71_27600 [Deltaproteobacteria bacterium]
MSDPAAPPRGLPGDCFVETAEGPVPMAETPNKGFAVLTRLPSGLLGFRQLIKVVTSERVPLRRIVLDSGHAIVMASGHLVYRCGMEPVPAEHLVVGDRLETAFHYPDRYAPPDRDAQAPFYDAISVRAVEPAGEGPVYTGTVRDTHTLFLTAGVLCGE